MITADFHEKHFLCLKKFPPKLKTKWPRKFPLSMLLLLAIRCCQKERVAATNCGQNELLTEVIARTKADLLQKMLPECLAILQLSASDIFGNKVMLRQ
ncbi:MAG: hypothetical protein ABW098_18910 [Candidatus Thiodiazotropha sp.]